MSPEEQKTILQFMGQTYGLSHKLDQDIVGQSQFLKPSSGSIRDKFEEILRAPIQESIPRDTFTPVQSIEVIQPAIPHNQVEEIKLPGFDKPPMQLPQDEKQIVTVLSEINLNLSRIGNILEKATNVKPKKIKYTGSE